ncbi:MAG: PqqD family protein [Spirochaetes bacterium]|jgi:hypothetical protein|nr:PqqD family protein [Spirochaetota bacterium]
MNRKRYESLALSENGFLFDTETGFTYTLNETGRDILQDLIKGDGPQEIAGRLAEIYDVPAETALNDSTLFINYLKTINLVPQDEDNGTAGHE